MHDSANNFDLVLPGVGLKTVVKIKKTVHLGFWSYTTQLNFLSFNYFSL